VEDFAKKLSDFFTNHQWNKTMPAGSSGPMAFIVGGYDDGAAYGRIFEFQIPNAPIPAERQGGTFGLQWGGQKELVGRLLNGFDDATILAAKNKLSLTDTQANELMEAVALASAARIPYQFLPLQDCIDLCILLIRLTAQLLDYQTAVRGVGGAIDVAIITRQDGFQYIQRKAIRGERERP
jgi:hypothetical protein